MTGKRMNDPASERRPWLDADSPRLDRPGAALARLIEEHDILGVPGAHDPLSGLLAREAGFQALYLSGAALSAARGLPDLGIMTMEELCRATRDLTRATGLPVIVDGDTGYGEALNAMRLVRELEDAGAAAVQIEDQVLPKKCGHLDDKTLVPAEEMARKIAAARRARRDLLIVARTDAAADSVDEAIARAQLYVEAGADIVFPEALTTAEDFARFTAAVPAPILANMTEFGRTPHLSLEQFRQRGVKIVIWPVSSLRIAAHAVRGLYAELAASGSAEACLDSMQTRSSLYESIGYADFTALDGSVAQWRDNVIKKS